MIAEAFALVLGLGLPQAPGAVVYRPAQRAVSNWRGQALLHVDGALETRMRIALGAEPRALPRCVRLNNYWCVKSARWNGEIAADNEGHVAFSSAHEGALVAARLLRRYYVDYGRRSAIAIVSRWAPAECVAVAGRPRSSAARTSAADGLTTRGIRNTARARWLAANRGRVGGKVSGKLAVRGAAPRPGRAATRPAQMMRAPSIAVGLGERAPSAAEMRIAPVQVAALDSGTPGRAEPARPRIPCASEAVRIRNYAASLARGIAEGPNDDLGLFDAAGFPTRALAQAMANMAAVEIGPLKAQDGLIEAAVAAHAAALFAQTAAQAIAAQDIVEKDEAEKDATETVTTPAQRPLPPRSQREASIAPRG
jgi:hypothetical protein